jgi:enolase
MTTIQDIDAYEILDSRGLPTVEAVVRLKSGHIGRGLVPSGASTGSKEALELRDGGTAFLGKGVKTAVQNILTKIKPALLGKSILEQPQLDASMLELDGTPNKAKLGANAILAVSMACARAGSEYTNQPLFAYLQHLYSTDLFQGDLSLPVPMMNIINGGAHADNSLDIQEFMIVPLGASSFYDTMRYGAEVIAKLKNKLKKLNLNTNVGDEGGFAPDLKTNEQAIELILAAINEAGFTPGKDVAIALDIAANELYQDGKYVLKAENKHMTNVEFTDFIGSWLDKYPIISIEDAFSENDWQGWEMLTKQFGHKLQIVGDDLFVTNKDLLTQGIKTKAANAILIKMNQIGTLTETFATIRLAKQSNFNTIISHRSGETEDTMIADLAVAVNAKQIKTGSLCRSERTAKYNQLLRIEHSLFRKTSFAGKSAFNIG